MAYKTGHNQQYANSKQYWKISIPFIILYSLIEGLRYLRGTDYVVYAFVYNGLIERNERLFTLLNNILHNLGVSFSFSFVVYSFIWIVCVLWFLKEYKSYLFILLPLFIIAHWYYSENFIRQYLAFSFNLISINYLISGKWKSFIVLTLISVCFHTIGLALGIIILIFTFVKRPIPIYISLVIYVGAVFLASTNIFDYISTYINWGLNSLFANSSFAGYVENSDRWFGVDAFRDKYTKSFISTIGMRFFDVTLLILGYLTLNKKDSPEKQKWSVFYNYFVYGAITFQLVMNIEILRRFAFPFYCMWPIIFVYIFIHRNNLYLKYGLKAKMLLGYLCLYIISYHIIKNIFLSNAQMFIWDMGYSIGTYQPLF